MAIQRLLNHCQLKPEEISRLVAAYEQTLQALGLKDRNDPITEIVARKVIEVGKGRSDPADIAQLAVKELGIS
jgi:hypothetical protein